MLNILKPLILRSLYNNHFYFQSNFYYSLNTLLKFILSKLNKIKKNNFLRKFLNKCIFS